MHTLRWLARWVRRYHEYLVSVLGFGCVMVSLGMFVGRDLYLANTVGLCLLAIGLVFLGWGMRRRVF